MVLSRAALMSLAASSANAFFLVPQWPGTQQRIDPIVDNATVASHVHHVVGGNAFQPVMNYETTQKSTCTTAFVDVDKSNYWVPQLYHGNSDGTFTLVKAHGSMSVYYLNEPERLGSDDKMLAFPKGFRMLAGDPTSRSDGSVPKGALNFKCLNYKSTPKDFSTLPDVDCPDGLRAEVTFPSCWDGVNLDSEDHKSHVAYPTGNFEFGTCPETHPVHLVVIKSEQIWATQEFPVNGKNPFVFATGDPTGYSYHADFLNGWDVDILQKAVDTCQNPSGKIEDCAPFAGHIPTSPQWLDPQTCKFESYVEEEVKGPLAKLPGCNAISAGPGNQKRNACGDVTQLKAGWANVSGGFGGAVSAVNSVVNGFLNGENHAVPTPTPGVFYAAPASKDSGKKIHYETVWVTVTETTIATGPAPTPYVGNYAKREEHVHKHRVSHKKRGSF